MFVSIMICGTWFIQQHLAVRVSFTEAAYNIPSQHDLFLMTAAFRLAHDTNQPGTRQHRSSSQWQCDRPVPRAHIIQSSLCLSL